MLEKIQKLIHCDTIACDTETSGLEVYFDGFEMYGASFAGFYGDELVSIYLTDFDFIWYILRHTKNALYVFFNASFDLRVLKRVGLIKDYPLNIADTPIGMNLLDENINESQLKLKTVVKDYLGHQMMTYKEAISYGKDSEEFQRYGEEDAIWTLKLWEYIRPRLEEQDLIKLFHRVYMPDVIYVAEQVDRGFTWDKSIASIKTTRYENENQRLLKEVKDSIGHDINLNSPQQLGKRLFDDLRYPTKDVPRTEKTNQYQLNAPTLEKLSTKYPVFKKLNDYRHTYKMLSTYLYPLQELAKKDHRSVIHTDYAFTSMTGRKRSRSPNLQNIPNNDDPSLNIRGCFVASEGCNLLKTDYSQAELRMVAHISGDENLMDAYRHWQCTACNSEGDSHILLTQCPKCGAEADERVIKEEGFKGFFHGKDIHQITANKTGIDRKLAKSVNFAAIYKASPYTMAKQFGTYNQNQWREILDEFFKFYSGLKKWHINMEHLLQTKGVVRDVFGRKRRIPKHALQKNFKHALNMFINFPVQSSCAHALMLAKGKFREKMKELNIWENGIWPVGEVHDELLFDVWQNYAQQVQPLLMDCMRYRVEYKVPFDADVIVTDSWDKCK